METQTRRTYDHRLKAIIKKYHNPYLFEELNIPSSTTRQWIHSSPSNFVTSDKFELSNEELLLELQVQKKLYKEISSKLFLLQSVNNIFSFKIDWKRLPNSQSKLK